MNENHKGVYIDVLFHFKTSPPWGPRLVYLPGQYVTLNSLSLDFIKSHFRR